MEIALRKPDRNDVAQIAALHLTAWQQGYQDIISSQVLDNLSQDEITARWHERITNPKDKEYAIVAYAQEKILGFTTYGTCREPINLPQNFGEIYAIYVHPDYWGTGIGKVLIQHAFDWFETNQYPGVFLWTLTNNHRARRFYERMGMYLMPQERYITIHGEELQTCCYCDKSIL